jgi:hypothetical protein
VGHAMPLDLRQDIAAFSPLAAFGVSVPGGRPAARGSLLPRPRGGELATESAR